MTKIEFLDALGQKLSGLAENEINERLLFYSEMIEDRMEEGLAEEEAVAAVGDIDEIAKSIMAESAQVRPEPDKKPESKPKRKLEGWEIALIILGIPVWVPLVIAAFVVGISLYVSVWSIIISIWACFGALAAVCPSLLVLGAVQIVKSEMITGIALIGASLIIAGLTVFAFYGCLALSKLIIRLTVSISKYIKRLFTKKEVES